MKKENWCSIIAVLLIGAIIYLLMDFKKSIQPFSNMQTELQNKLSDTDSGLNNDIDEIQTLLNTNVPLIDDSEIKNIHLDDLNKQFVEYGGELNKYNLKNPIIDELKKTVDELSNIATKKKLRKKISKKYQGIKSENNGLELKLDEIDNNKYLVRMNGGCLSINDKDYDVYKCNPKDNNQIFKLNHIFNEYSYANQATHQNYAEDKHLVKYPFVVVKSNKNNNCISNIHNNIRVLPCDMLKSQRWNTLDNEVCH